MLVTVPVPDSRSLDDYAPHVGAESVERLREAAAPLHGARVVHLSSTAFGGGVAELLHTQVAILRDLGIEADWRVIEGSEDFFAVTKLVHNALQGAGVPWTESMEDTYLQRVEANASRFEADADFVIVHDPQPVAILAAVEALGRRRGRWVWRCHIDLSQPMEAVWAFFAPYVGTYDATVYTLDAFVREGGGDNVHIIPPSIDPLAPKNVPLDEAAVDEILMGYGIDGERPIISQVSRFDPWKDPLGTMDAYRRARERVPGLQLVMVGSMAHDDPEGWHYLELTEEHRGEDPDIHVLTNLQNVGAEAVNAFQRASDVVVQKSIREGFGLTCAEAMWKGRPVVAGAVGGLCIQVEDGETGFLVDSVDACGDRLVELLEDEDARMRMGKTGRERVRQLFVSTREAEDHVRLLASLEGG